MLYAANPSTQAVRDAMNAGQLVCITTPAQGNRIPDDALVCLDNGCFGAGYPGDDGWMAWLESQRYLAPRALFAVAPDVVGDAHATYERSAPFLPFIRSLGFPAAYVAQDGQEFFDPPWDEFDCLFIGGSTTWKLSGHAAELAAEAKRRDKWVHMGRVNSWKRWRIAESFGCDSADGTCIAIAPDVYLAHALAWSRQPSLFCENLPRHAGNDYPTTSQLVPERLTMRRAPEALPTPTGGPNPPSDAPGGGLR